MVQTSSDGKLKTARGLVLLGVVLGIGTMGYMIIERCTFLDAL